MTTMRAAVFVLTSIAPKFVAIKTDASKTDL